ncbi:ROK family protein [Candidatus Bipolaricaulota sp. J31]
MEIKGARKGNNDLLRRHNRALIVNLLRRKGPLSRAELSRLTGLAPSALSRLSAALISEGLVRELGKTTSSSGRPPILLGLNPDYAFSIGVKIEARRVLAARVNLLGRVQEETAAPFDNPSPEEVLLALERAIRRVFRGKVLGIGIAVSGFVDSVAGACLFSPILGWYRIELAQPLAERFDVPVHVENDVNALTLAEARYGAGKGLSDFICVTVGEGLGAGIVIGGRLYRGAFGGAGEFGHTLFAPEGPRCRCGERGCLEVFASDQFLRREAAALGLSSVEELVARTREGDPAAEAAFRALGEHLGYGLKDLVNLLNPEAIVIGGERTTADGDLFVPYAEEILRAHAFAGAAERVRLVRAELGEEGFLVGAAEVFVERFFAVPIG